MPQREKQPISAAQLGLIVEDAASEIFIFSATDFRFLLVNRGARENLGYGLAELRELSPWDIKPELTEEQFRRKVQPLIESGAGDMVFETVHRRKNGSLYDVSVHLQLLRQDGEPIFFAAIRDVTRENELRRELEQRECDLEKALAGREMLLQEVNHRVKNSLQVVMALLQLHARQAKEGSLRAALADARNRVAVVASIHQRLYMGGDHSMVDIGEFLEDLVNATVESLAINGEITTELDLEPGIALGIDEGVPLVLIVAELLTNSLKYAFTDGKRGTLGVVLGSTDKEISVKVYDDGKGYSTSATGPDISGSGLGSKIIKALSRQLRAKIMRKTGPEGTAVTIILPRN